MKNTRTIYSIFLLLGALLAPSVASAQSNLQAKPIFPFFSSEKSAPTQAPVQPITPAPVEITEDTIDLETLRLQPLSVRRKLVAAELNDILLRLNVLYDKTKVAAGRLSQNEIDTSLSQTELASAALSLANARLTIDALITAANDPKNESLIILPINGIAFKEVVVKAEDELRAARASIITTLASLKAAVSASISTPSN